MPGFIPDDDPRKAERDGIYAALLDAMLQKGVADYELAQTFPAGSPERAKSLKEALEQFESLYKSYRTQLAGLAAQMYQAKCYEENGDINSAIGIYKQLMEHGDPRLRGLQRNVGYFYIVALSKRKQYALAADEASRWLTTYNRRDERRSPEGLGVLIELAKDIDAQMAEVSSAERPRAVSQIVDAVSQVVRFASPFKKEAMALLKKYKPSAAVRAEEIARLTYEDLVGQADDAIASHEWERAITLLTAAIRKADPAKNLDKANMARYNLAFCYYMNKQFYEAAVLAEHYARRYPQGGLGAKSTEIGMQAWADAYSTYTEVDRRSDLNHLIDLAKYTAETWPDKEQGDGARINLGQIYLGMGQYDKAIEILGSVRRRSRDWASAQNRLGSAHWAKSRDLERRGDATAAQAEAQKAIDVLNVALKARRDANAGPTDPGLVGNVGDLATVLTETGKPAEALKLLDPIVKAQTVKSGPGYAQADRSPAQGLYHLGQGRAGDRLDEGARAVRRRERPRAALLQAGQAPRKGARVAQAKEEHGGPHADASSLQDVFDHPGREQDRAVVRLAPVGRRGPADARCLQDAEKVLRRVLTEFTADPQFLQQPAAAASCCGPG